MVRNFPSKISWSLQDDVLYKQLVEIEEGICIIEDIGLEAPKLSIKNLFRKIYGDPQLSQRLNDVYPARGIFKEGSKFSLADVDRKVSFDLSPSRLRSIVENDKELVSDLGGDFHKILSFYNIVQEKVIPRLVRLAEKGIDGGSELNLHQQMNYNYRLVDYYPVRSQSTRCGEHRDYGTFTLIFQDQLVGGLEVLNNGSWVPVPPNASVVFLWGWSAAILSNGRIKAPLHRVTTTTNDGKEASALRRNAAIFFVAPDLDVELNPRVRPDETLAFYPESVKDLTVERFKAVMGRKWRHREGTLTLEEQVEMNGKPLNAKSQDDEIISFLKNIKV